MTHNPGIQIPVVPTQQMPEQARNMVQTQPVPYSNDVIIREQYQRVEDERREQSELNNMFS